MHMTFATADATTLVRTDLRAQAEHARGAFACNTERAGHLKEDFEAALQQDRPELGDDEFRTNDRTEAASAVRNIRA